MAKHIHIHLAPTRTADRKVKDASFSIDDIAVGGTVIYKDGGSFKKAKAVSKSGMRVKLDNGKEIHVGDVVSTDASDWAKYSSKDDLDRFEAAEKFGTGDAPNQFPSLYKTAESKATKQVYKVLGQDDPSKEKSSQLLLDTPEGKRWFPISNLNPVL